jgi:hypothetical protein
MDGLPGKRAAARRAVGGGGGARLRSAAHGSRIQGGGMGSRSLRPRPLTEPGQSLSQGVARGGSTQARTTCGEARLGLLGGEGAQAARGLGRRVHWLHACRGSACGWGMGRAIKQGNAPPFRALFRGGGGQAGRRSACARGGLRAGQGPAAGARSVPDVVPPLGRAGPSSRTRQGRVPRPWPIPWPARMIRAPAGLADRRVARGCHRVYRTQPHEHRG